ncbi:O-antigen ligase family protein [Candidatus Daviesbacteria bacterium]|nr:O-antigen ligase family protein [Candidatus Daviesbacteria bacterium]
MNLVWFLTVATVFSLTLGEFGQYPFGNTTFSLSITDIFLALSLIFLLIWQVGIKREIKLSLPFKFLTLFWGWGLLTLLLSQNIEGIFYLFRFVMYSSVFYLGYLLIQSKRVTIEKLLKYILISAVILALMGFLQLIFFPDFESLTDFGFDPHKGRIASTFLDPNFLGIFLNLGFLIAFYLSLKSKKFLIWLGLITLAIILTYSRTAYLLFLLQSILIGLFKSKKLLILILVLILVSYFLIPRVKERALGIINVDITAQKRIESWAKGLIIFQNYPVFGVGFNNLRDAISQKNLFDPHQTQEVHSGSGVDSGLIFVLATTGIIGLFIYLLFWANIFYQFIISYIKEKNFLFLLGSIWIVGLFVSGQFINALFYPAIMLPSYLLFGGLFAKTRARI